MIKYVKNLSLRWPFYWQEAINNLWLNKLRSMLAIIGILVGSSAVVSLISIGEMAKYRALAEFKTLGIDLASLTVNQHLNVNNGIDISRTLIPDYNYAKTLLTLPNHVAGILQIAPAAMLSIIPYYQGKTLHAPIIVTTSAYQALAHLELEQGRFINPLDRSSYFCVLGHNLGLALKATNPKLVMGDELLLGPAYFKIIGIARPWQGNPFINNDVDNSILISLDAAHNLSSSLYIETILLQLNTATAVDSIETQIRDFLNKKFPELTVTIKTGKTLIETRSHQKNIFTWMLGMIGGIGLLVGGIGIMNVMLVSVIERKKEIGIRLALGAKKIDIQIMFLLEAGLLVLIGGISGIIIALLISGLVADFLAWPFIFSPAAIMIGFFAAIFTGIFFGLYPAYQASQLNPIEVLRSD